MSEQESAQAELHFSATPYQADEGSTPSGLAMLFSGVLVSSALLGFLVGWVQQYFYLIILFPILIGLVLGFVSAWFIKRGKVRSSIAGIVAGLLGGIVAALSTHYYGYSHVHQQLKDEMADAAPETKELLFTYIDAKRAGTPLSPEMQLMEQMVFQGEEGKLVLDTLNVSSLLGYIDLEAKVGVTITRGSGGFNLGYIGTYIYWLIELGIISFLAFMMVNEAVSAPFCTRCNQWKEEEALGGMTPPATGAAQAVLAGELGQLKEMGLLSPEEGEFPVKLSSCAKCGVESPVHLKLEQTTTNEKGEKSNTTLAFATYPGKALPTIRSLFKSA